MSYRAFKRLLGETSLERKCRFLFGAFILLLITGSFWLYARQTEHLAYDQLTTTCRLIWTASVVSLTGSPGRRRTFLPATAMMRRRPSANALSKRICSASGGNQNGTSGAFRVIAQATSPRCPVRRNEISCRSAAV